MGWRKTATFVGLVVVGANLRVCIDYPGYAGPLLIAASHQTRTGRAADIAAGMEIGETHPFLGHPIEVRGRDFTPITPRIAVAHVIGHDDDEVGLAGLGSSRSHHRHK